MRNLLRALVATAAILPVAALASITDASSLHNLSSGSGQTQVCVFCHTPHGANTATTALWNRRLPTNQFVWTKTNTVNGTLLPNKVSDGSLKCLSCHDGSQALGDVMNGPATIKTNVTTKLNGTEYDLVTGTNNNDLGGNHPVGVPYPNQTTGGSYNGINVVAIAGFNAAASVTTAGLRLYPDASVTGNALGVECGSCHDPHGVTSGGATIAKFLRKDNANSALCTTCHAK